MLVVACRSVCKWDSCSDLDTEWTASPWQLELHKGCACMALPDTFVSSLISVAITHMGTGPAGLGRTYCTGKQGMEPKQWHTFSFPAQWDPDIKTCSMLKMYSFVLKHVCVWMGLVVCVKIGIGLALVTYGIEASSESRRTWAAVLNKRPLFTRIIILVL